MCSRNINIAVRNLRMYNEPNFETAQALLRAALVSIQGGHGSISWALLTSVTRMVVDLGYHHLSTETGLSPQRTLFWHVYAFNKILALTFNRSANIPDHETTTSLPISSEDFSTSAGAAFLECTKFAQFIHEIHEHLLSSRSRREDPIIRTQRAYEYSARLIASRDKLIGDTNTGAVSDSAMGIWVAATLTVDCQTLPTVSLPSPITLSGFIPWL